jgi:DNA repair exonuclease SbcCD ATPase subunit/DNA repair exonuclease SbcCD nuclease subunit
MFNIKKIIHLADIHIRLFKRHEEYRQSFETLYAELRASDLTNTAIVVAGDIVHAKTDLSPEMVELASEFLRKLADIAPTLVIAGNHDLNLANQNRMDALSPIIRNLNHYNLTYCRDSGIYEWGGVDFYVHSIIGDRADWPVPVENGRTKVALYHGPVDKAVTDVNYHIKNKTMPVEVFDGFDMVLLGDIHKHQVLQSYDAENKKPVVVYASSLIQQNHGEAARGHGYCIWDVPSRSFEFRELANAYGYYTLTIDGGVVPDYSDMPENAYLRIFAGEFGQADIKKLVSEIRGTRTIKELSVTNFEGAKLVTDVKNVGQLQDLTDIGYQNKLIVEYLRDAMPSLSDEVIGRVLDLNKQKNEEISTEDLARKIVWRPKTLKFDNLFTYGEGNYIDFETMQGVVGIFAPNASGKTSIAEAICFALYDRTPRTIKAANIMNTRKNSCSLEFAFEIDGAQFVIERRGKRNNKGEVKIDVDFYTFKNGQRISLNGEERRQTNLNIREYVGDFEDFLLTTFSSSSQQGLFVDRGQSDRKDLLGQFMGLNIFDKLHTLANDEIKEIAGALKRFKNDDFTQELATVIAEMKTQRLAKETAERDLESVNLTLNDITSQIQGLLEKKTPISKSFNIGRLEMEMSDTGKLVGQRAQAKVDAIARLDKLAESRQVAAWHADQFPAVQKEIEEYEGLVRRVMEGNKFIERVRENIISLTKRIELLEQYKYDENCEFCLTNGRATIAELASVEDELNTLIVRDGDAQVKLQGLKDKLATMHDVPAKYLQYKTAFEAAARHERDYSAAELEIKGLELQLQELNTRLKNIQRDIDAYHEIQGALKDNERIDVEVKRLEEEKRKYKTQFTTLNSTVMTAANRLGTLERDNSLMLKRIAEAEDLEAKYEAYEAYLAAVSRDGLPYRLLMEVIPTLEISVNQLLSQMVNFTLAFETDGKNIHMKLRYDDTRVWPLELASGMEKFISSLAIRVALAGLSALPKGTFLIIDEGLGTLDPDNLSSIFMLFDVLRTKFEFLLLISHVDSVRDIADSLIEIHREDGFSQIEVS